MNDESKIQWLVNEELPRLAKEGLLTPENTETLKQYYAARGQNEGTRTKKLLPSCLSVLGGLLLVLGILLILVYYLDEIPPWGRITIGYIPLMTGFFLLAFGVLKNKGMAWMETAMVFCAVGIGKPTGIIMQTFQLGGERFDFFRIWMILLIPFFFIRRTFVIPAAGGLLVFLAFVENIHAQDYGFLFFYWFLPLAFILYNCHKEPESTRSAWFRWILIPYVLFYPAIWISFNVIHEIIFIIFLYSGLLLYGLVSGERRSFRNPVPFFGFGALLILMLLFSHPDSDVFRSLSFYDRGTPFIPVFIVLFILTTLIGIAIVRYGWKKKNWLSLTPFILMIAYFLPVYVHCDRMIPALLSTAWTIFFGIMLLRYSLKKNSLLLLNSGIVTLLGIAWLWFSYHNASLLLKGIGFMIFGILFLVGNLIFIRKTKYHCVQEECKRVQHE